MYRRTNTETLKIGKAAGRLPLVLRTPARSGRRGSFVRGKPMRTIENRTEDMIPNALNILLGITLVLAPWYLELSYDSAAARNAFLSGGAITVVALLALGRTYDWEEYLNLALGLWAAMAPWALGFAETRGAMGVHVGVGLAVAALAAFELRRLYVSPQARSV